MMMRMIAQKQNRMSEIPAAKERDAAGGIAQLFAYASCERASKQECCLRNLRSYRIPARALAGWRFSR